MKSVPSAVKLAAFLLLSILLPAHAAVRETWVQHFDGGFPNKASQPVAMQLDSQGNIYIVGSTANTSNLTDYVTLKYAPNGTLLWSNRYGSTNGLNNTPRAMGIDTNNNLYITGTSVTVKYSPAGDQIWTAPFGGRFLGLNGTNVYAAGYSDTQCVLAKLSNEGTTVWTRSHPFLAGPDLVLGLGFGLDGAVYLAAELATIYYHFGDPDKTLFVFQYSTEGAETILHRFGIPLSKSYEPMFFGVAKSGRIYLSSNNDKGGYAFDAYCLDANGIIRWESLVGQIDSPGQVSGCLIEDTLFSCGSLSGKSVYEQASVVSHYAVRRLNESGEEAWSVVYPEDAQTLGTANAIMADPASNTYTTGFIRSSLDNDCLTLVLESDGRTRWLQRYDGAARGHDEGRAIARDASGNVYVAAVSDTTAGGTEIVLLKYSESATLEQSPTGTILLQFPGTPGQPYKIQASTNLPNWLDIGLGTATTNGLLQFEDTNATKYPFRFYQTVTP